MNFIPPLCTSEQPRASGGRSEQQLERALTERQLAEYRDLREAQRKERESRQGQRGERGNPGERTSGWNDRTEQPSGAGQWRKGTI